MTAVMQKLDRDSNDASPMRSMASARVELESLWGASPPAGAGHTGLLSGSPLPHYRAKGIHGLAQRASAQAGQGTGAGKNIGAGRGNVNGGQSGVAHGRPDPSLPAPVYPEESSRRGEEGVVTLSISVLGDGTVGAIEVISEPPYPRLTRAAIDAVRQVRFDAAYARTTLVVPYVFNLH